MTLIDNARHWHRMWSVRFNMLGLALLGWIQFDPASLLLVWNMMPVEVRDLVPPRALLALSLGFFALSLLSRVVSQPKIAYPPRNVLKDGHSDTEQPDG